MTWFDPNWLIHIGAALMLLAYCIRDELKLRVLIVIGSIVYNFYYYFAPREPLWDAIFTGFLFIGVNAYVLVQVMLERTTFRLNEDEKRLFEAFETLTPGQFRRVLRLVDWRRVPEGKKVEMTRQGEPSSDLYFIFDGLITVEKDEHRFRLPAGNFVGEVAFVLDGPATATTVASDGTQYVAWNVKKLKALGQKHPPLGNALSALLTRDLANKLTSSYRPDDSIETERA